MAQQWYVVHTYSGFENRAKQNLEERIKNLGKGDFFSDHFSPHRDCGGVGEGKEKDLSKKNFPWIYIGENGIK